MADANRKDVEIHATWATPTPYSALIAGMAIFKEEDMKLLKNDPDDNGYKQPSVFIDFFIPHNIPILYSVRKILRIVWENTPEGEKYSSKKLNIRIEPEISKQQK